MNKLTAPYALKKYIVEYANLSNYSGHKYEGSLDAESEIEDAFADMYRKIGYDAQQDIMSGHFKTEIEIPYNQRTRHCEVESVAVQDNYGNWIGFPHWHSGGKHFDEYSYYECSIDSSYYLSCEEKEVLAVQRTWTKI